MARILVVDDNELVRDALQLMLDREGHDVIVVADGRDAIALLQQQTPPDLVITDLIMPHMEGIEAIETMRKLAPELVIVAISGGDRLDPRRLLQLALRSGADAAIAKPPDRKEFMALIGRLLP